MVLLCNFETSGHTVTTQTSYITHIIMGDVMHTKRDENKCDGTVRDDNQMKRQLPRRIVYEASVPPSALAARRAFFAALAAAAFAFFASAFATYINPSTRRRYCERRNKQTFSASSFVLASSSARRFSSSACALEGTPPGPGLFLRFASRASFSSCLMRLMRGSAERATSTIFRRRAVSSFLRRARSVLFFFSVYRLSSRLKIIISHDLA